MTLDSRTLQFQQLSSAVDISFWSDFTKIKLNSLRLSEKPLEIKGYIASSNFAELQAPLQIDNHSLSHGVSQERTLVPGALLNLNTFESFKTIDHKELLKATAQAIWGDIKSGAAESQPNLLCRFILLSYAELKSYKFYYWFAFPALKPPVAFQAEAPATLQSYLGDAKAAEVVKYTEDWVSQQQPRPPFWLVVNGTPPVLHPLSSWDKVKHGEVFLASLDPGNAPGNPGWPLRNLLLLASFRWRLKSATVVCFRKRGGRFSAACSLVVRAVLPELPAGWGEEESFLPEAVGWELNAKQKLGPRVVSMGASMDPTQLAESAADLNIRLMKWRAAVQLDIDRLASSRCLLLGAGTLGCAVARTLLGWGVRSMTLLDNSRVSYSNPVRQSLYEFADCLEGGSPKAEAAAKRLRAIFPKVEAQGVDLSIPMPGHPLSGAEVSQAETSVNRLEELIKTHDVVFLLMDTRESRWLPTLLCATHNKLAINAALGFDSFLVMRHGAAPSLEEMDKKSMRLGCYYCNDVVAPLNSTIDRTLDQQCTVARPGLASIAGSLAVELMASVLQHPEGVSAPASSVSGGEAPLGTAPHMIRGQLGTFSQMCLTGQAFRQCTACSSIVVQRYRDQGWGWLLHALQDPKELEDLTGLTDLKSSMSESALEEVSDSEVGNVDDNEEFVSI